jgi:PPOX class probable F420-dependent enzyme
MPATTLEGRPQEIMTAPNYAHIAIPREDGTVQTVVAWADLADDGDITLNSAEGRAWPANLRRAGTATVTVIAEGNPMEWVSVTGRLVEDTHEGADEHIDELSRKYLGTDYPMHQPDMQRVKFVLRPERVYYNSPPPGR